MTSSFKPGGTVSASISLTKPYLYSRLAKSSILSVAVFIANPNSSLGSKRRAATTGALNVRILKNKTGLHELILIIEFGSCQIQKAFHVNQDLRSVFLENLVGSLGQIEIDFVLQP